MKKTIFLLAIVALFGVSSCGKDYTCTCNATGITTDSVIAPAISNQSFPNSTKSHAQAGCSAWQKAEQDLLNAKGGGSVTCNL